MKRIILISAILVGMISSVAAQKFAIVDMEYILKNIPSYETANEQLNIISKKWQSEVETKMQEVQSLYKNYQTELVFLSEEMKVQREEEIIAKEKEAPIKMHKTPISKNLSEKECNDIWEQKMWPHIKKKISEHGFEKVINDDQLLSNFSKSLSMTNDELKEKICITAGVV